MANNQEQTKENVKEVTAENVFDMDEGDMKALGYTDKQIAEHFGKKDGSTEKVETNKGEEEAVKEEKGTEELKTAEIKKTEEQKKPEEKKKDVISELLYKREADEKARKEAEAKGIESADISALTPEQLKERVLKAEKKLQEVDVLNLTRRQDAAYEKIKTSVSPEEWDILTPEIKKAIESSKYDVLVKGGAEPEEIAAEMLIIAKHATEDARFELRIKAAKAQQEAEEKIIEAKNFNVQVSTGSKGKGTREDELKAKADKGTLTKSEQHELNDYLFGNADEEIKTAEKARKKG